MNMGGGGEKDESKMTTRILARTGMYGSVNH